MTTVVIPPALRALTAGQARVEVEAADVRGLIRRLDERFPGFAEGLGSGFAVAIDGEIVHDALFEPVAAGSEVHFVPPVSGG